MRLFLGIFPTKEIIESFTNIQKQLEQYSKFLRFVDPDLIHLSLRFLGNDVSKETLEELSPLLKSETSLLSQFNVRIKEARFGFPGRRWPRILYASVVDNENLLKLSQTINSTIEKLNPQDIFEDKHSQNPIFHFTIARTKARLNNEVVRSIRNTLKKAELWEGFGVNSVKLMSSVLRTEGPEYEVVEEMKLNPK